jgi:copper oxidase (laccase) domain-containing protein
LIIGDIVAYGKVYNKKREVRIKNFFPHRRFTTNKAASNTKGEVARKSFFLFSLKLNPASLVCVNQVHGNTIKIVSTSNKNTFASDCDGLITADKEMMLEL